MSSFTVLADSGSSKTDWVVIDDKGAVAYRLKTLGFNPYFHSSEFIANAISPAFHQIPIRLDDIAVVNYYGAGCSSEKMNRVVKIALDRTFPNALVYVDHDMIAAARASLGNATGIACIIGTGSNSCVWDQGEIIHNVPSHGYIFGDEGSGSYLGIQVVKLYLEDQLPARLKQEFEGEFHLSQDQILARTYQEKDPNVFLAQFARFYDNRLNYDCLRAIVRRGFENFFRVRILPYPDYQQYALGFIGSIAFHNQEILAEVAAHFSMRIRKVCRHPIDELVDFHRGGVATQAS
ncbi:MAG: BadF/BadG/BcrA/BcrD ATPase family protein [Bacteroidota bacterium]